jgi:hypothetical protein
MSFYFRPWLTARTTANLHTWTHGLSPEPIRSPETANGSVGVGAPPRKHMRGSREWGAVRWPRAELFRRDRQKRKPLGRSRIGGGE